MLFGAMCETMKCDYCEKEASWRNIVGTEGSKITVCLCVKCQEELVRDNKDIAGQFFSCRIGDPTVEDYKKLVDTLKEEVSVLQREVAIHRNAASSLDHTMTTHTRNMDARLDRFEALVERMEKAVPK